jgi:hypothetical protein
MLLYKSISFELASTVRSAELRNLERQIRHCSCSVDQEKKVESSETRPPLAPMVQAKRKTAPWPRAWSPRARKTQPQLSSTDRWINPVVPAPAGRNLAHPHHARWLPPAPTVPGLFPQARARLARAAHHPSCTADAILLCSGTHQSPLGCELAMGRRAFCFTRLRGALVSRFGHWQVATLSASA